MNTFSDAVRGTISTWKALFLREAVNRLSSGRTAWVWIIFEPLAHILFFIFMFTVIRVHKIGGIDTTLWIILGMLAFFIFRRSALLGMKAIDANKALFAYRQVKPVDTVIVRAAVEVFLMLIVGIVLFCVMALFHHDVLPENPLLVISALFGVWLVGVGFGLISSVAVELIKEMEAIIGLMLMPLYFLSSVMFPITTIPEPYREYLLYNPLAQGIELIRHGFSSYYHTVDNLSLAYVYFFAIVMIFLGLALHNKFADRLVAQ